VEVKRAWLLVTALEQTLQAVRSEVAAAEENYKTLQNQYKAGTATSLDAQNALRDLNSSRTLLATRTYDYQVALRGLERVMGNFQEDRVKRSENK
jgi:outer membrane protein TolC